MKINNIEMDSLLTFDELLAYIKEHGIAKVRLTKKHGYISTDTELWVGIDCDNKNNISSFDVDTDHRNKTLNFDYQWIWDTNSSYTSKFEVLLDMPERPPETATEAMASRSSKAWLETPYSHPENNFFYGRSLPKMAFPPGMIMDELSTTNKSYININKSKKRTMLQRLSSTLKRILSPALQAQYRAGLRNGNLALTNEGKDELVEILAVEREKELTARAKEMIVELEKDNDCK